MELALVMHAHCGYFSLLQIILAIYSSSARHPLPVEVDTGQIKVK